MTTEAHEFKWLRTTETHDVKWLSTSGLKDVGVNDLGNSSTTGT